MSLTPTQEQFAARVASKTGLDRQVVRAWVLAEGGNGAQNQNWLNLSGGKGPGGRFDHPEWGNDPIKSADATAHQIMTSDYYTGIMATVGGHAGDQIHAIAMSPWDAGHYNGGKGLVGTYNSVSGTPIPTTPDPTTPSVPKAPKMPETIDQAPEAAPELGHPFVVGDTIAPPNMDGSLPVASPFSGGSKLKIPPPPVPAPIKAVDATVATLTVPKSTVGDSLVASARSQLGVPYLWGAESPGKSFDCSGLVQWAAKAHGLTVPRVTTDQVKSGVAVNSVLDLQPGDLLFFGADHHHVAIYSGHGKMIEAPHKGTNVREVALRTGDLTAMRRLSK